MLKFYCFILALAGSFYGQAQQTTPNHIGCDNLRFRSQVFTSVDTTLDVQFGFNQTYAGNNKSLYMDIFEPSNDLLTERPVVILAFGGSFINGQRQDVHGLCQFYASRGYVAAAIDYRTLDAFVFPDSIVMGNIAAMAISDMKAAVRYFREDAATINRYKVDVNNIIVGGISSGGITALHTAYGDSTDNVPAFTLNAINSNGGWTGNSSTNTQYSNEVHAVLNYSGALIRANFISANEPPLFSVHDDNDGVVPYGAGYAKAMGISVVYVEGSQLLHQRAQSVGVTSKLITLPGSGHVSYLTGSASMSDSILNESANFLHNNLLCTNSVVSNVEQGMQDYLTSAAFPNPATAQMILRVEDLPCAYTLRVYNQMGQLVVEEANINDEQYILQRNNLSAGVYHIELNFEDKSIAPLQHKVIFQ